MIGNSSLPDSADKDHWFEYLKKEITRLKKENKKLTDEIEELKANLARAKEDHQYDNLVHQHELESLRKK